MNNKDIIKKWVALFNEGNSDGISNMYHEYAINHQVATEPVNGKAMIKKMFQSEFASADMHCIIENIFEDGDWVILEWKDPLGLRGCGFFNIVDGKIKFQRGYWDKLSFLRAHKIPLPTE